jgi:hypothetical protein
LNWELCELLPANCSIAALPHYRIATFGRIFCLEKAKFPYLCSPFTKTMGYGDSWYRFGPASPGSIFKREKK